VEPLGFIEILGRHNDVLARHAVYRWPARVGRGYDAEVILDDPFVAPRHASIEPAADGRFRISDLQSVNGFSLPPSAQRVAEAEVGPDDVVRLGRTQIRIRPASYAVPPEQRLRATALYRRPSAFTVAASVFLGLILWGVWVATIRRDDEWATILFPTLATCIAVTAWISVWSLVSRIVGGRANFSAHGFVACATLAAIAVAETLFEYLSFGFNARWLDHAGTAAVAALGAFMLYRHLRLNSRAPRATLGLIAATIVLTGYGIAAGLERAAEPGREGLQRYDNTLKSPRFLWVTGATPAAFLAEREKLRHKADAAARVEN
jgi:hypothetical protein